MLRDGREDGGSQAETRKAGAGGGARKDGPEGLRRRSAAGVVPLRSHLMMARVFNNVARSLPTADGGVGPILREYALPIAGILLRLATLGTPRDGRGLATAGLHCTCSRNWPWNSRFLGAARNGRLRSVRRVAGPDHAGQVHRH